MEIPRYWRLKKQRYALVGETCPTCSARIFPPRPVCPYCSQSAQEAVEMKHKVEVVFARRLQPVES